jgi:pyruvate,water dikinase
VQDPVHFPRPISRYWAELHPEPFARGTSAFMAYYGMPLKAMRIAYVNGIGYRALVPAPAEEIAQRFARAEEVFPNKVWRDQLREWDEIAKPTAVKIHRELQSVDADALSDEGLAAYLARCRDHHSQMIFQHMRFTGSAMIAVGDLLGPILDKYRPIEAEVVATAMIKAALKNMPSGVIESDEIRAL